MIGKFCKSNNCVSWPKQTNRVQVVNLQYQGKCPNGTYSFQIRLVNIVINHACCFSQCIYKLPNY